MLQIFQDLTCWLKLCAYVIEIWIEIRGMENEVVSEKSFSGEEKIKSVLMKIISNLGKFVSNLFEIILLRILVLLNTWFVGI